MKPRRIRRAKTSRSLLLIVPLLCLGSARAQHEPLRSRELTLECPVNEFDDVGSNDESYEGRFDAYSKGGYGRSLIEKIRTKPESYYQNIVDNVIMLLCDVEAASERCVEEDSPFAAKDWSGENCIKAADYECGSGTCERASNCYWNSVHEGQNRTTRFEVNAYDNAATALYGTNDSYARELAQLGAIGVIIAILLLLFWVAFFIGRYLCCCLWIPCSGFCFLCSPIPKRDGYNTFRDVIVPAFLYLLSLMAITAAGAMAFVGNEDISVALSNTFLHADGLVEDLGSFLGRSKIPLVNIRGIVNDAALDAKSIFDGTEFVKDDALQIVSSFLGFYELHSEGLNASNTMQTFDSATAGFESKVTPITDNVQSMLDTLELDLYGKADTIEGGIASALDQLDSFSEQSSEWQDVIYAYEGQELGVRDIRRAAVMTKFLISFFFAFLGFLGILMSKRRSRISSFFSLVIKVAGFFSAWLGSLSLVVASILLCSSFILHDACQISDIVTRDFEPFVGDKVSPGANACFNDTNLAVAFNVTDKVDFQQKLDEGIQQIEGVNVTEKFQLVLEPLSDIQSFLGSISESALSALNQATSSNGVLCPFADTYSKETIMSPWDLDRSTDTTPYTIRNNLGDPTSYDRVGLEDGEAYFGRIYDKTGVCSAPSSCCIELSTPPSTCESNTYADCDYGVNCTYPCEALKDGIVVGYNAFAQLYDKELAMTADLGVVCPDFEDTCPTQEFQSQYANLTLVGLIEGYRGKIIGTKGALVNLASTSVGALVEEVEDFLCNMNVSFVEQRYDGIKHDICGTLFGGVAQITWAFFLLGVGLEVIAIIAHLLTVRLRGLSEKQAAATLFDFDGGRELRRADVYG